MRIEKPMTGRDRLAYAIAGNSSARIKAGGSVKAGTIGMDTGKTVLMATDKARLLLDLAGADLGVPVGRPAGAAGVPRSMAGTDIIDTIVTETISATEALLPVRTVSTMISAAHASGEDLTDEAMLAVYGMDDDARAGLIKTLESK
jgi:hypothetical protein